MGVGRTVADEMQREGKALTETAAKYLPDQVRFRAKILRLLTRGET